MPIHVPDNHLEVFVDSDIIFLSQTALGQDLNSLQLP
jgi:hypothetical protein